MATPQKFFGFKGPAGGATDVDVVGALRLRLEGEHADTGEHMVVEVEVPQVRVCPDQEDDFLAANPVLLDWGWEPGRDSIVFHALGKIKVALDRPILPWTDGGVNFKVLDPATPRVTGEGVCALREVKESAAQQQAVVEAPPRTQLVAAEQWTIDAFEERTIKVNRVRLDGETAPPPDEDWWLRGKENVARGPVKSDQKEIYVRVVSGAEPREVGLGQVLGTMGPANEDEQVETAAFNAAAEVCKDAVNDIFGKSRIDEYADGWLGPDEFGPILAMLENCAGGATLSKDHLVGVRIHQKARNRLYTPGVEGVGVRCREASIRITMKHFPGGERRVEWDFTPGTPGKTLSDKSWLGYTLFVKRAASV
jgi:hypothetical protein